MGFINKIREKTGLAVGIIALGLGFFVVGGDLLGPNSTLLGGNTNKLGEINGTSIKLDEFQSKVDELSFNFSMSSGRNPTSEDMFSIRQQAWDLLVNKYAYEDEFDEIGISVSDEEVVDMVQGNNISPEIIQAFTNPETGQFDRDQIITYLQNLSAMPAQQQAAWYNFEGTLAPSRLMLKFDNLFIKTNYVTQEEAKREYEQANKIAEVKYLYVPFYTISDSSIAVTDSELQSYLNSHADQYQRELSRSLEYISFPIIASADDTLAVIEEINEIKELLTQSKNDSLFARANSDAEVPFKTFTPDQLPAILNDTIKTMAEGDIIGPLLVNDRYAIYKLSKVTESSIGYARANHILIKPEDESDAAKATAKVEARKILNDIKKGASFSEMARLHGTDGTSTRGGDLGWFGEGRMVEPFEDAVFATTKTGLLNDVVETDFGYHIIEVTSTKTNTSYKVTTIEKEIIASDDTRNLAYRDADMFALSSENIDQFRTNAAEKGMEVQEAKGIAPNARRFGTLADGRSIIIWLYNQGEVGKVSEVYELDSEYVVAAMTGEQPKGVALLSAVKDDITSKVKDEKKAAIITDQLKAKTGTLDEISEQMGADASVYSMSDLKLSANALTGVGNAPEAVGKAFALAAGERSDVLKADNGVVIVETVSVTDAPEATDFETYKSQLAQRRQSRISFSLAQAIREFAAIEDERYKFF